jgi:hypothetical protein
MKDPPVAPPGAPAGRRRAASLVWFFACLSRPYPLSIAFGSSLDARQAGSRQATAATKIIVAVTTATVDTSVGPTPNNSDAISRCRPKAPASPITTPTPARRRPPSSRGRARWTADWVSPFQNVAANFSLTMATKPEQVPTSSDRIAPSGPELDGRSRRRVASFAHTPLSDAYQS